jgi:hypothetical protein
MLGAGLLIYGNPTECSICSEGPDSAWIILLRAVHVWNTKLQNSIKLGCIKRRASQRNYIEKEKSQSLTYIVILCYLNTIYLLFLLNIILMRCDLQWIQVLHTNLDFFFIHVHIAHNWMPWSPNPIQILAAIYILPRYAQYPPATGMLCCCPALLWYEKIPLTFLAVYSLLLLLPLPSTVFFFFQQNTGEIAQMLWLVIDLLGGT